MATGVWGSNNGMSSEKEGWGEVLSFLLEMGAMRQWRPKQVVCYRAEDENGGLDLEKRREK